MSSPEETIAAGRLLARHKAPYFRARLLSYVVRPAPGCGTVYTSKNGIFGYDPDFISTVTPDQMCGLWLHETLHGTLEFFKRIGMRDPRLFNMAQDLCINPMVEEMGASLPPGGLMPEAFGFPRGLTADDYYERLLAQANASGEGDEGDEGDEGSGKGCPSGGASSGEHAKAPARPHAGGGWCGGCAGAPTPGEPGEGDPEGRSEAEVDRINRQVADAVHEYAAKQQGKLPAGLAMWAERSSEPARIPWRTRIARATRRACTWRAGAVQHRYDAPGRRQAGIGFGPGKPVLPRLRTPVPRVTVVIDTSGSMGQGDIGKCLRELGGILRAVGADVDFMAADAAVQGKGTIRRVEDAIKLLRGGGGTDFRPVFEDLSARGRARPEIVIFATDGYGTAPSAPPAGMTVIWLLVGAYTQTPAPWGEVINIDLNDLEDE